MAFWGVVLGPRFYQKNKQEERRRGGNWNERKRNFVVPENPIVDQNDTGKEDSQRRGAGRAPGGESMKGGRNFIHGAAQCQKQ